MTDFNLQQYQARVLAAALYYAGRGWHVIPVTITIDPHQPLRKKEANFHFDWKGSPTTDLAQINKWFGADGFAARPYQGLAIATGKDSDLVVVDVDNEMLWDYFLTDKGLAVPETFRVKSQSGKSQFYFSYPEALGDGHLGKVLLPKAIDEYNPEVNGMPDRPRGVDFLEQGSVIFAAPTIVWAYDKAEGTYTPAAAYEVESAADLAPVPESVLEEYLAHSKRPRSNGGTGTGPRTHNALTGEVEDVNPEAAERQREDILQWAKDEFEMLINDPGSYWDNGCVRVAGVLVRLSNNPVFDFSEADVYDFFASEAPMDEGFGAKAHDRIIQSAYRMAGDEVIEFDATTYDVEPQVAEALQKIIRDFANDKGQQEHTEAREEAIAAGASPDAIPEKRASSTLLPNLPDSFWSKRAFLTQIRRKAWERLQSPDAVLHSFLAGYASEVDWQYEVDTGIGSPAQICYFTALVAPSGAGKGGSMTVGLNLAQVTLPKRLLGTGEGIAQSFLSSEVDMDNPDNFKKDSSGNPTQELVANPTKIQVQVNHNMLIADSEASVMDNLSSRKGATLIPTLLRASMGEDLGNTNATAEANRHVPGGSYAIGAVIGIQIETAVSLLSQTGSGFSQRWGWASLTDPAMPRQTDPTPPLTFSRPLPPNGEEAVNIGLDQEIKTSLANDRYMRATGQMQIDPFDSHKPVKLLQAAALFRLIDGPNTHNRSGYMITQEDWELANDLYDTSREVRIELQKRIAEVEINQAQQEGARMARVQSAREDQTKNVTVEKYRDGVLDAIRALVQAEKNTKISYIQQRWSSKTTKQKIAEIVLPALIEEGTLEVNDGNYIIVADKK